MYATERIFVSALGNSCINNTIRIKTKFDYNVGPLLS